MFIALQNGCTQRQGEKPAIIQQEEMNNMKMVHSFGQSLPEAFVVQHSFVQTKNSRSSSAGKATAGFQTLLDYQTSTLVVEA